MHTPGRSPILRSLLKLPGQDADSDLHDFVDEHLIAPLLMLLVIGTMCLVEWSHYLSKSPPNPWVYTFWFIGSACVISLHWRKQWKVALAKKLGRDGERAISEFINIWLAADSRVLHNVPIDGGIADHVLICRKGIFVIETKTRSLPRYGKPVVHISELGLRVSGYTPDRDPVAQVQRYIAGLQRTLAGLAIANGQVAGIIVYPGWDIVDDRTYKSAISVLNPRDLDDHLGKERDVLSVEEVTYLTRRIAQHVCSENAMAPSNSERRTLAARALVRH